MSSFSPSVYFELSGFAHAQIFSTCQNVWDAIPLIDKYLRELNLGVIETEIPSGAHLINPELISIGKGTVVEPGAYIKGPCVIGKNCSIRHGAYIRGGLIAGDGCVIGHDTEIKNSILLNEAHAAHFAYVGDSILGNRVNLGAGTICANLKFDRKEVSVYFEDKKIPTGLKKFGVILGDDVQTGCHCVINPGSLLGKGVWCYPCLNFGGVIPSQHVVKSDISITTKPKKS